MILNPTDIRHPRAIYKLIKKASSRSPRSTVINTKIRIVTIYALFTSITNPIITMVLGLITVIIVFVNTIMVIGGGITSNT